MLVWRSIVILLVLCSIALNANAKSMGIMDPTRPPDMQEKQTVTEKTTNFQLTAIINKSKHKLAIINGHVLKKGDIISGARIKDIADSEVVIYSIEGTKTLRLINQTHGNKIIKHNNK